MVRSRMWGQICCLLASALLLEKIAVATALYKGDFTGIIGIYNQSIFGCSCCDANVAYPPPGYLSVAINDVQYRGGNTCESCVKVCGITKAGAEQCFLGTVDSHWPGAPLGAMLINNATKAFATATWSYIQCPPRPLNIFVGYSSTPTYARIRFQHNGKVQNVTCNGFAMDRWKDGWWVKTDKRADYTCGLKCKIKFQFIGSVTRCISGKFFKTSPSQTCSKTVICP